MTNKTRSVLRSVWLIGVTDENFKTSKLFSHLNRKCFRVFSITILDKNWAWGTCTSWRSLTRWYYSNRIIGWGENATKLILAWLRISENLVGLLNGR